ncbi:hypothetical protein CFP59_05094 [Streptomyces malaysiensis subsp. malaysiensis]|nr:DUF397 domain-containing protein [Streptomyces sp. M56]AUA12941.1 hypothetical protein CFP59_05094 [Streptomyces sp. M56]
MPISDWRKSSYSGDSSNCINVAADWRKSTHSADAGNCVNMATEWRKSTGSGDAGNCVGVAASDLAVLLRESDEPGIVLTTTPAALRAFIQAVRAGNLDRTLGD